MKPDQTIRTVRGKTVLQFLPTILQGVCTILARVGEDRKSQAKEALDYLRAQLSDQRKKDIGYAITRSLPATLKPLPVHQEKSDHELQKIARYMVIGDFEELVITCFRYDFPDVAREILWLLIGIPELESRAGRFYHERIVAGNPLGHLWRALRSYEEGVPFYTQDEAEQNGRIDDPFVHQKRYARIFWNKLGSLVQASDPGATRIAAMRLYPAEVDEAVAVTPVVVTSPAPVASSPPVEESESVTLTFTGAECALLRRVVKRHGVNHGEASPAEVVKSIIVRLGEKLPP